MIEPVILVLAGRLSIIVRQLRELLPDRIDFLWIVCNCFLPLDQRVQEPLIWYCNNEILKAKPPPPQDRWK